MEGPENIQRRYPTRATKRNHRFIQPSTLPSSTLVDSSATLPVALPSKTRTPSPQRPTAPRTVHAVSKRKTVSNKFIRFRFQLDCSAAEEVDVDELVNFIRSNMKIEGRKNNISEVTISRRNANVEIMAKVMVKKKYLKLLSKKFLQKKKIFDYRVVEKNKRAYKIIKKIQQVQ